jgi:hypothetical protein
MSNVSQCHQYSKESEKQVGEKEEKLSYCLYPSYFSVVPTSVPNKSNVSFDIFTRAVGLRVKFSPLHLRLLKTIRNYNVQNYVAVRLMLQMKIV